MPITGLPTFEDNEIPSSGKFNQIVQALESKFSAITADDFTWPLVAQGNIDMGQQHSIIGLRTFWNYINAAEYDSLQLAVDAAEAAGGGCVIIPPDTTITADGVNIENGDIIIMGAGPSSVIKLTSGSTSGYLMRNGTGGLAGIEVLNLTFDGQSTGVSQDGFQARHVDRLHMYNVFFKNFTGDALYLTNDGTNGNACSDCIFNALTFDGGTGQHIKVDDLDGGSFSQIISRDAGASAIVMSPLAAASFMRDVSMSNARVTDPTGLGIWVDGASGTADDKWSRVHFADCRVSGSTDDAFRAGAASAVLKYATITGCTSHDCAGNAYTVNTEGGAVKGNYAYSVPSGKDGIDLVDSTDTTVSNNTLNGNSGTSGIDADGTDSCYVHNNTLTGTWTNPILSSNATNLELGQNQGAPGPTLNTAIADNPRDSRSTTGPYPTTYEIPANSVKPGDVIRITVGWDVTGYTSGNITLGVEAEGAGIGDTGAVGAVGEIVSVHELYVSALSGASNVRLTKHVTGDTFTNVSNGDITIDFTADVTIEATVTITGAAVGLFDYINIEFIGGNQ